jgi:uncharacterized protein YegL
VIVLSGYDLEKNIKVDFKPQPHLATVLLLDTSGSMDGYNIKMLNEGLQDFKEAVTKDELARKRVELAVVTFGKGGVKIIHDFSSIEKFEPPTLYAEDETPMGKAILRAIELVESRKEDYKFSGIDYFRPWIFMISDGEPTDMKPGDLLWNDIVKKVHDGEANRKFLFFAVGVDSADMDILGQISHPTRVPLRLKKGKWKEMFEWLSKSQIKGSQKSPGDQVSVENPASPTGWAEIPTS